MFVIFPRQIHWSQIIRSQTTTRIYIYYICYTSEVYSTRIEASDHELNPFCICTSSHFVWKAVCINSYDLCFYFLFIGFWGQILDKPCIFMSLFLFVHIIIITVLIVSHQAIRLSCWHGLRLAHLLRWKLSYILFRVQIPLDLCSQVNKLHWALVKMLVLFC